MTTKVSVSQSNNFKATHTPRRKGEGEGEALDEEGGTEVIMRSHVDCPSKELNREVNISHESLPLLKTSPPPLVGAGNLCSTGRRKATLPQGGNWERGLFSWGGRKIISQEIKY